MESLRIVIPCSTNKNIAVGIYYLPPDQDGDDCEMLREVRGAIKIKISIIIMEDFSYPHIDWVHVTSGRDAEIKFPDTFNDCFLEQLVLEPTRGEAILDLVLSGGAQDLVQEVNIAGPLGNSDHNIIKFNIPVVGKTPQQPNTVAFKFRKGTYTKMRRLVKQKLKGTAPKVKSLQAAWKLFKDTTIEAQFKCIHQIKKHNKRIKKVPP
ncbi:unnamed protein product [Caretta caretta]